MKKFFVSIICASSFPCIPAFCQWNANGTTLYTDHRVGIGTNDAGAAFHVVGTIISAVNNAGGDNNNFFLGNTSAASTTRDLRAGIWLDNDGRLKKRSVTGYGTAFRNTSNTFDILYINDNGLSIGTDYIPPGYSMAVNGNVIAQSITVKLRDNWPDFVFKRNYKMLSLNGLKKYIDQNHHLPDIPTEKETVETGINLERMNALLLKKVEELTTYLIEQNDTLRMQGAKLREQEKSIKKYSEKYQELLADQKEQKKLVRRLLNRK